MTEASLFVRPNLRRNGFDIKLRNRLGVKFYTEAEFYARPGQEAMDGQVLDPMQVLLPDVVQAEQPEVVVDNVGFYDEFDQGIEIIYVGMDQDDEQNNEAVNSD